MSDSTTYDQEGSFSSGEIVDIDDFGLDDVDAVFVDDEELEGGDRVLIVQHNIATGEATEYSIDLATPALTESEARRLTEEIKNHTNALWLLIQRAHKGKAYLALGYGSFEEYARTEFDISRSYAYKLLNQANVIAAIETVIPEGTQITLTAGQAAEIKPVLPEVLASIEERTADLDSSEAGAMIEQIMREQRDRATTAAEDEAEDSYQPDYSGEYNPNYAGNDEDEDDEDDEPADAAGGQDDAEIAATRDRFSRLYQFYTALKALSSVTEVEDLIEFIPPVRRGEFSHLLGVTVPLLSTFDTNWRAYIEANPVDDDLDDEGDDDEDLD